MPSTEKSVAKMIFKPYQCAGFSWPPYQCRFTPLQSSTEVSLEELRINCFIKRNEDNLFSENKAKLRDVLDYNTPFEAERSESLKEGEIFEDRPMYPNIPDFLKKILSGKEELW